MNLTTRTYRRWFTQKIEEFKNIYGIEFDENLAYANGYVKYPEGKVYSETEKKDIQKWIQQLRDISEDVGLEEAREDILLYNLIDKH